MKMILSLAAAVLLSATAANAADINTYFEQQSLHGGNHDSSTICPSGCTIDSEIFQGE